MDSAKNCAATVHQWLKESGLLNDHPNAGTLQVALTDAFNPFLKTVEEMLELRIHHFETRVVQGLNQ